MNHCAILRLHVHAIMCIISACEFKNLIYISGFGVIQIFLYIVLPIGMLTTGKVNYNGPRQECNTAYHCNHTERGMYNIAFEYKKEQVA